MSHPVTIDSSHGHAPVRFDVDLFCRVIDNFGDVAVCWRLARCLARDHGQRVRLWVDAPEVLAHIKPQGAVEPGVEVRHWNEAQAMAGSAPIGVDMPARCVIEAFACDLPQPFVAAMRMLDPPPRWINLEYLSAETWIEGCHALPSHDTASGLTKYFFFPGFTPRTGGLLRERDLFVRRDAWLADAAARACTQVQLGMTVNERALQVSLFSYESTSIATLIDALAMYAKPVQLWVPEGRALVAAGDILAQTLKSGDTVVRGALQLHALPFMDQDDYDRLLWQCDLNIVRGEDSFVRAQWAARPMLWHIYPQHEDAHLVKLEAFLDRYTEGLDSDSARHLRVLHRGWNGSSVVGIEDWCAVLDALPVLARHARCRVAELAVQNDLAAQLVMFNQTPI